MKIALINLEPKIENIVLMKIAAYHKLHGDNVEWYADIFRSEYDKIYCSSLFDYTDKSIIPQNSICGGTGFNLFDSLPLEIENCELDYSIYPNCRTSYLWFSRGCVRNCPFCVVRQKEGYIKPVEKLYNLNPNGEMIDVVDNNFFANPEWEKAIEFIEKQNTFVNFHGIDVRTITEEQVKRLSKLRFGGAKRSTWVNKLDRGKIVKKQMKIAWDNPREDLTSQIKMITKHIKPYRIMCYVLIGYWSTPEEDLMRIKKLQSLKIDPFVMPYNKSDEYQKLFARWVNMKAIFRKVTWEEYSRKLPRCYKSVITVDKM